MKVHLKMQELESLLAWFGGAAALTMLLAGASYSLFRFLGVKWIEQKFSRELEDHKHAQAIELQKLRIEIDTALSGSIFTQNKELEEIEQCWGLLLTAIGRTATLVSAFQSFPDLDRFDDAQLEEFLDETELYESQKRDVRESRDRLSTFMSIINLHRVADARAANSDLHRKITAAGVFLTSDIDEAFRDISDEILKCIARFSAGLRGDHSDKVSEANELFENKVIPLRDSIRYKVSSRIRALSTMESA